MRTATAHSNAVRMAGWLLVLACTSSVAVGNDDPTRRAVAYLAREVPAWHADNDCYSCHNNGDGVRALVVASKAGFEFPDESLRGTLDWLKQPDQWEHNGGEGDFIDYRLAWLQFSAALAQVVESSGNDVDQQTRDALETAARKVSDAQSSDGSWKVHDGGLIGAPATWGPTLSTVMARRTLRIADATRYSAHIARADEWLKSRSPRTVMEAAAILSIVNEADDPRDVALRNQCLDLIQKSQSTDGAWGPYEISPPEPFDTALVLLALKAGPVAAEHEAIIAAGRSYLIRTQLDSGGWQETTRPAGAESYAQHISTTAWATLALLATE